MESTLEVASQKKASIWSTGLAMFAMFFGAGNIVFPLALGQYAQNRTLFGVSGLICTAVLVPLLGLFAMLLFDGNYSAFFRRIGRIPGFMIALMILGLIGPFGGIPRCVTISFSTLHASGLASFSGLNLWTFSFVSCVVIFLFTFRPNQILNLLGYVLTPILLLSLAFIVAKGIMHMPAIDQSAFTSWEVFSQGLLDGYNTMDLLAAFFFSSVVLHCLKKERGVKNKSVATSQHLLTVAFIGSLIAAVLLGAVYLSFSFLAAGFSSELSSVASHEMLGALAYKILGPYAGLAASVTVSFACLTTEIALTAVFAEFLHETIFKENFSYQISLLLTLVLSFFVSTLQFEGITAFLVPILQLLHPALIVLCVLNVFYKTKGFQPVKILFYGVIAATALLKFST